MNQEREFNVKIAKIIEYLRSGYRFRDKLFIFIFVFLSLIFLKFKTDFLFRDVIIKNPVGIFFCRKNKDDIKIVNTQYENGLRSFFNLKEGVFIDIGAHIGNYTIMVAKKLEKKGGVISIEPEKNNFNILLKNIKLNKLRNIIPLNVACFSKKTILKLYLEEGIKSGSHSIYGQGKYERVPSQTLDEIVKELKLEYVKLIKIDVEGAEAEVLKGAKKTLKKSHPKIIFEAWGEEHFNKVKKILERFDYKIKNIYSWNYLASRGY